MKFKTVFVLSSFLIAIGFTACPGGGTNPGTGNLNVTFSNASGATSITQTPFSATAGASNATGFSTTIAGKQGNRLVTLMFAPIITANRTCTVKEECGFSIAENGVAVAASTFSLTAAVGGGNLNVTGTATFTQINGITFNAQVNATIPYTP